MNADTGKPVKVSQGDRARLRALQEEIQARETEIAKILSHYLGDHPFRIVHTVVGPTSQLSSGPQSFQRMLNDGNGHCGVYDESTGECKSVPCGVVGPGGN